MIIKNQLAKPKINGYMVNTKENEDVNNTTEIEIIGLESDLVLDQLKGLQDGSLENYINMSDSDTLKNNRCQEFTNLKTADIRGIKVLGPLAFYGCSNLETVIFDKLETIGNSAFYNCAKLDLDLSKGIKEIGEYAFRGIGNYNVGAVSKLKGLNCQIGAYAFNYAKVKEMTGSFTHIGTGAFNIAVSGGIDLEKIDIEINGHIYQSAFQGLTAFGGECKISGNVTQLDNYAFYQIGSSRSTTNYFILDFKNSTFTTIGLNTFAGSTGNIVKYLRIYLPSTLSNLTSGFTYGDNNEIYFTGLVPPTLSSGVFANNTNMTLFIPYNAMNAYRTATNWTTYASNMKAFTLAGTFTAGETLPVYNDEGYPCTWYTDKAMTQQVTTCPIDSPELYCSVGATKEAIKVLSIKEKDCDVVISDGVNTYVEGDFITIGTSLTITCSTEESGYIPYKLVLNNVDITSSFVQSDDDYVYTFTAGQDNISLNCKYWDGVNEPYDEVFANNSWTLIKKAAKQNEIPDTWLVGDTKQVTFGTYTYDVRIVDKQVGRYKYVSDDSDTRITFEFVKLPNDTLAWSANTSVRNYGGFENSYIRAFLNGGTYWTNNTGSTTGEITLDNSFYRRLYYGDTSAQELYAALEDVKFPCVQGGTSNIVDRTAQCKLFLGSFAELAGYNTSPYKDESYLTDPDHYQWDYYKAGNQATRQKVNVANNVANSYWSRTTISSYYCYIGSSGGASTYSYYYNTNYSIAPCFAF